MPGGPSVFQYEFYVTLAINLFLIVISAYAFVQALLYKSEAYAAADKLTKPLWSMITFGCLLLQILFWYIHLPPINFLGLAAVVTTLVFICEVKPAVAEMQGGR